MTRLVTSALLLALAATPALATHPNTGRVEKKVKQRFSDNERQTTVRDDDVIDTSDSTIGEQIVAVMLCTDVRIARAFSPKLKPEYRLMKLLNELDDRALTKAGIMRLWLNNQPRVLTYQRINGAIGP